MKRLAGGVALIVALSFVSFSTNAVGQPAPKAKTVAPPKSVDKAPDKTTDATTFEVYKDNSGKFRFRIKSGDTLLATSGKGYDEKAECMKVIKQIQSDAAKAKIDDQAK